MSITIKCRHAALVAACLLGAASACAKSTDSDGEASPFRSGEPLPSSTSSNRVIVRGSVVDNQGAPVRGCTIDDEGRTTEEAIVSDADGRFTLHKPSGTYKVTVVCPEQAYRPATASLTVPGDRAETEFTVMVEAK